ncbi:amidohydrolase [Spirosoma sp. BT702]|uniref:Amidohydrolase n=1 Tax=Spirosoma profusum TaxID=2771354 RepID=A0A927ASW5_9BACT|nr:amidohydrolase [Spirosoma profusum]MBD2704518.1 amidohydrolase [Spirosoma profusum]
MNTDTTNAFIRFRRELHQFPERSGKEVETQSRINAFVRPFNPVRIDEVGGTGLLLQYGADVAGPTTVFRADTDALPIQETNTFAHRSTKAGISHKCGHDGHTAIMARLASLLAQQSSLRGRVYLLFQPAEETGQGAQAVLNDPIFAAIQPDRIYALHNLPGFPQGAIICKSGSFTPSVQSMIVTFHGRTSHAAEPENGANPAYVMADFLLKSKALINPDTQADDFALITPVHTVLGHKDYGTSAGYGEVHLTLRTWTSLRMEQLVRQLVDSLSTSCNGTALTTEITFTDVFFANENHQEAVEEVRQATHKLGYVFTETEQPFKWGEDFGLFTQQYKGAMFGIGAGEHSPALHNDDYDFNDALIEPAARLFLELVKLHHG